MIVAYRLFRKANHNKPEVLFHSVNGTKILPLDTWIKAEIKQVWNPGKTNNSPGYISGFHVGLNKNEVMRYTQKFKNPRNLIVSKVYVSKIRPKPRSISNIFLADDMFICSNDWYAAIGENNGKSI